MAKFRSKPKVIEAIQLTGDLAICCLCDRKPGPFGLHVSGSYHPGRREVSSAQVFIKTLEGNMRADIGDWIIRGINGELYPCKPDIFEASYEAVEGGVMNPGG